MGACNAKDGGRGQITILHQPKSSGCLYLACVPLLPEYFPRTVNASDGTFTYSKAFHALSQIYSSDAVLQMLGAPAGTVDGVYGGHVTRNVLARELNPGVPFPIPVAVLGCPRKGAPWEVVGAFRCLTFDRQGVLGDLKRGEPMSIYRNREQTAFAANQSVGVHMVRAALMQFRMAFPAETPPLEVPWPRIVDLSLWTHNVGSAALIKELACHAHDFGTWIGMNVFETLEEGSSVSVVVDTSEGFHHVTCPDSSTIARACTAMVSGLDSAPQALSLQRDFPGLAQLLEFDGDETCNVVTGTHPRSTGPAHFTNVPVIMRLLGIHAQARAEAAARAKGPVRVAHNPYAFAALEAGATAPPALAAPLVTEAVPAPATEVPTPLSEEPGLQRLLKLHGACYPSWGIVMSMLLLLRELHVATRGLREMREETFFIYVCREIVRTHRPSLALPLSAIRESSFTSAVVMGSLLSGRPLGEMRQAVMNGVAALFSG